MNAIMNYYRQMDPTKIQFDFLCFLSCQTQEESYEKEILSLGGSITYIKKLGLKNAFSSLRQLDTFFRTKAKQYDWLQNHEVYLSFLLKPMAAKYGLKHFIVHCHATKYSDRSLAAFRNHLLCLPIRWMHCKRFACSTDAASFLYGRKCMKEQPVFIMRNAIAMERYHFCPEKRTELRRQYQLNNCFVLGHIGRLERQKNHSFLLDVFALLHQKDPRTRLLLVGDGSLMQLLKNKAKTLEIADAVLFLGARNDVPDLLQAMDLYLLPSLFEGVGISLLEAQANGLECLASEFVPKEAAISSHVHFLPLPSTGSESKHEIQIWADKVLTIKNSTQPLRNLDVVQAMEQSPYNIDNAVEELLQQYQQYQY
ncbi:MAG: glycosyltransferase [bacterium]|nr:glycosyltransferase [bacterium]